MKAISSRLQIQLIAFGYAVLLLYAAGEWYLRHLAELQNPVDAQGGMWAFGDEMLAYYLFFLFLFPTFFLLRLIGKSPSACDTLAKCALALALTAPLSAILLACNISKVSTALGDGAALRLFRSPMVFILLLMSRAFARQKPATRLLNWSLVVEAATIGLAVGAVMLFARLHR